MNELTNCEVDIVRGWRVRGFAGKIGEDLPLSLLFSPALERPAPASLAKLERSFALRGELNPSWAARPVELVKYQGRPSLLIEDRGREQPATRWSGSTATSRGCRFRHAPGRTASRGRSPPS